MMFLFVSITRSTQGLPLALHSDIANGEFILWPMPHTMRIRGKKWIKQILTVKFKAFIFSRIRKLFLK